MTRAPSTTVISAFLPSDAPTSLANALGTRSARLLPHLTNSVRMNHSRRIGQRIVIVDPSRDLSMFADPATAFLPLPSLSRRPQLPDQLIDPARELAPITHPLPRKPHCDIRPADAP